MSETAKNPEENIVDLDKYKKEHLGFVQKDVEDAIGEKVQTVQSPHDQELSIPENIIHFIPQKLEEALGQDIDKVEGVTDPTGTGFKGWFEGFFRGKPRIANEPLDFMKAKVKMAETHGQEMKKAA